MEFLTEYASFLAKTVTLVIAILVVLASFAALRSKGRRKAAGQLQVSKLNDFYKGLRERLEQSLLDKDQLKALRKGEAKSEKKQKKKTESKPRVFVLDFDGDIKASATESLRHEITALLTLATPKDEVVLRLESGGGMVHSYGLASSQLARIREAGVPLTVCIDKVAASGGYMMACIGEKVISAPFAILGSIGVVAHPYGVWRKHREGPGEVPGRPGYHPQTVQELRRPLSPSAGHRRSGHRRGLARPRGAGKTTGGRTQDQ